MIILEVTLKRTLFIMLLLLPVILLAQSRHRPCPAWGDETDADSTHSWDALHYDLRLRVTPVSPPDSVILDASVTIRLTPTVANLDTIDLHFIGLEVTQVRLGSVICPWSREDSLLYITLPDPMSPGDTLDLDIDYEGVPSHSSFYSQGLGILHPFANMVYTHADPRGLRYWMPSWDEPWDKATLRQTLEFPSNYTVVANGIQESVVNLGAWKHWTYFMDKPIVSYLVSFCAAQYDTFQQQAGNVAITNYIYPQHLSWARNDLARVPEMIATFSEFFGAYPFATFGYAESPMFGGSGAMENQTMVTIGSSLFNGTGAWEDIYAHELAHQWFGDATGYVDWPEMWLSEGFATYGEALWHQHLGGMNGYHGIMNGLQNAYMSWENPGNPHSMYNPPWNIIWTPLTYEKGACILHMLRYEVGDSATFFAILQDYFEQYCYGTASTQDLKTTAEQIAGDDYTWFFDQWVYQAGFPQFQYFAVPSAGGITLTVAQTQSANFPRFRSDADLYCYSGGMPTIHRITIQGLPTQEIQITLPQTPDSVKLDPVGWILGPKVRRDDLIGPILVDTLAVIADADSSGFLDPGESGELFFTVLNSGLPTQALTLTVTSLDPELIVTDSVRSTPIIPYNGQYSLFADPIPVTNVGADPRWIEFRVQVNQGTVPLDTLWFSLPVGTPRILLVDDDVGGSAQVKHQTALNGLGQVYRTVAYVNPDSLPLLSDYQAVIWSCGQQTASTLSPADQSLLQGYLDGGGCLFLSGRGVVPDLAQTSFMQNVLHATAPGATGSPLLQGADPLVQGLTFFVQGENSLDVIEPDGAPGSARLLTFQISGAGAAVKYDGDWKSVALGFGFEDIVSNNPIFATPQQLLGPVLDWFGLTVGVEPETKRPLPVAFKLEQNYPNPFNSETMIPLELPQRSHVKIELFNVRGQSLGVIFEGIENGGWPKIRYNASRLASGMYFCQATAEGLEREGKYQSVGKLLLLK
jgi:hypothetical protein